MLPGAVLGQENGIGVAVCISFLPVLHDPSLNQIPMSLGNTELTELI